MSHAPILDLHSIANGIPLIVLTPVASGTKQIGATRAFGRRLVSPAFRAFTGPILNVAFGEGFRTPALCGTVVRVLGLAFNQPVGRPSRTTLRYLPADFGERGDGVVVKQRLQRAPLARNLGAAS